MLFQLPTTASLGVRIETAMGILSASTLPDLLWDVLGGNLSEPGRLVPQLLSPILAAIGPGTW